MSLEKITDSQDELIAKRFELALATQTLADSLMREFERNSPILPLPTYRPREQKRRSRIYAKIQRYIKESPRLKVNEAIERIDDMAGGRFLVHYIGDTSKLFEYIRSEITNRNDIKLVGVCRNCINKPKPSGFRALTQDTLFKVSPRTWFPFEIQIMTFLAHDWDQKQHVLYESREEIPGSIHGVFSELSQKLYDADKTFDRIRDIIGNFTNVDTKHN